jgi:phosphoglycerate dehydrogenase-like enzyme
MQQTIYVTEPQAIDTELATRELQGSAYQLQRGDTACTGGPFPEVQALLIRSATKVDSTITQHFPNLKSVIRVGVGLDNVDLEYCKQAGLTVFNAPGANANAVSDYVTGMVLYALRRVNLFTPEDIRSWNRFAAIGDEVAAQTVGIVGFGNIGRQLHHKLEACGCQEFLLYDPYLPKDVELPKNARMVSLAELFTSSAVISLHLPLTDETRHIVSEKALATFKDGAILINAARGGIVDEAAVLAVADKKQLTYVADTVENEPQVSSALLDNPRVIITPHIAGVTRQSEQNMVTVALQRFLSGQAVPLS